MKTCSNEPIAYYQNSISSDYTEPAYKYMPFPLSFFFSFKN